MSAIMAIEDNPPVDSTIYDIVITEIMYNPPESSTDSLEFIEIYNNEISAVDLTGYSLSGVVDDPIGDGVPTPAIDTNQVLKFNKEVLSR